MTYSVTHKTDICSHGAARAGARAITKFDLWTERVFALRQNAWAGFSIGAGLFVLAVAIRLALAEELAPFPFLTFFPAIILTAVFGGVRPALIVTLAATLVAWRFFVAPDGWTLTPSGAVGLAFFISVAIIDVVLIEMLHRIVRRFSTERARTTALLETREAMFKELQHRVANNMQFVSAMLTMQQRQMEGTLAADALEEAAGRFRAMARVHRRLYDPANADRAFGPLVEEVCHELLEATGAKNIVCRVEVADVRMPLDRVLALSMIVTEAMTNAIKHAFPDGRAGTIRITLERLPDNEMAFVIADDGKGMPEAVSPTSRSLGMRIVQSFAQQLQGEFSYGPAYVGSEFRLRFKAAA